MADRRTRESVPVQLKTAFTKENPIDLAGGLNLYGFGGGDPVNYSDPFGLCPIPPSSCVDRANELKEKVVQTVVTAFGVAGEATGVAGLMRGASGEDAAGNRVGYLERGIELAMGVFAVTPSGQAGKRLKNASSGLRALFDASGNLSTTSMIGVRSTLREHGFTMRLADNKKGYLMFNGLGEEVRLMRGQNGWYMRIKNADGNYLDHLGNPGSQATTHLPLLSR